MADAPTDAELLARGGRDAQAGFGEIVHRHSRPLYAVAYRWLEQPADAEEVVQDAFLLLWRKRGRVHLVGDSALPWLIGSTVCTTNSAGVPVCNDGPALGVPGAVLATFWLSVLAIAAAVQVLKKR